MDGLVELRAVKRGCIHFTHCTCSTNRTNCITFYHFLAVGNKRQWHMTLKLYPHHDNGVERISAKGNCLIIRFWQYGLFWQEGSFIHLMLLFAWTVRSSLVVMMRVQNICSLHLVHWPFSDCWVCLCFGLSSNFLRPQITRRRFLQESSAIVCNKLQLFSEDE